MPPKVLILQGTWSTFHPREILHAIGAVSVYIGLQSEPRLRTLQYQAQNSVDSITAATYNKYTYIKYFQLSMTSMTKLNK